MKFANACWISCCAASWATLANGQLNVMFDTLVKRDTCSADACVGKSNAECVQILCDVCGPINPSIKLCCAEVDLVTKMQCFVEALQDGGDIGPSNSSNSSSPSTRPAHPPRRPQLQTHAL
ncbi:Hypothetical protein R9X50_00511400 [Acrodontium crateriforme]|uniref:Uncharacterized protein n=1 Tax=Acrodontium crateriforme TaxID=150365 RepID=A0AAQ3M8S4_9PEZI|nr:Hypothetical protein R9X50_00511400 [Acrodontium crateriforme]